MEQQSKKQEQILKQLNVKSQKSEKKSLICRKCHAPLEEGALFCTECGEKIDGEERICPICSYSSASEFCPNCGYKLIPSICPKCGTECHESFCEKCGEILDKQLEKDEELKKQAENKVLEEAPKEIIQDYIQNIQNRQQSDEEKKFIEKMEEHKILLEERGYFNDREKRIIQKFGINLFGMRILDPIETTYASKLYDSLSKTIRELDEQRRLDEGGRKQESLNYKKYLFKNREKRYIGRYICQYNVHFIEITNMENGVATGYYGEVSGANAIYFNGTVTGNRFLFSAKHSIYGGNNKRCIYGYFSNNGKIIEESGFCCEPLFFKFH